MASVPVHAPALPASSQLVIAANAEPAALASACAESFACERRRCAGCSTRGEWLPVRKLWAGHVRTLFEENGHVQGSTREAQ